MSSGFLARMAPKCSPTAPSQARLTEAITDARIFQTKQLLEGGVELEFVDDEGLSPLLRVCLIEDAKHRTRSSLLKLLLQHGANVNSTDRQGRHTLAWACAHGKEDIVRLLLAFAYHDIDLNKQDVQGNTPLMQAVKSGNPNIVKLILEALKKYQIDIDVRNHDDRTPYLEAKLLGHEECAEILLKEGKASKNIQVNPFLDFMDEEQERLKGEVRGVEGSKGACAGAEKNPQVFRRKAPGLTKVVSEDAKRTLKRKLALSKYGSKSDPKNLKLRHRAQQRRKHAWDESKKTHNGSVKTDIIISPTKGALNHGEQVMPALVATDNDRTRKTTETPRQTQTFLSVDEFRVAKPPRPFTAQPYGGDLNKSVSSPDLRNCDPGKGAGKTSGEKRPRGRPKTGFHRGSNLSRQRELRHSLGSSEFDVSVDYAESVNSWYSHFSLQISPSITFLQRLMAIYAEQVSPQSSYRSSVRSNKIPVLPPRPTIVQPEDDARSEGGRSSAGSTRSARAVSPSLRKFSAVTRSVISSKRVFASMPVLPTKPKVL